MLADIHWRTPYPEIFVKNKINYKDPTFTCGSCFASELSLHMERLYLPIFKHPFGIVFNPISIGNQFKRILTKNCYTKENLWHYEGLFHSPDHHGVYSNSDVDQVLDRINSTLVQSFINLERSKTIVITLGSAHYYEHKQSALVVSNCHKMPQQEFDKRCATVADVLESLQYCISSITKLNPAVQFNLSVSPVRYLKDGFHENSLSKSILLLAVNELCQSNSNVQYFPAYELFIDELREYRFTKSDLIHPNQIAIDYIFSRYCTAFYDEESLAYISRLTKFNLMKDHKILHEDSEQYLTFQQRLRVEKEKLKSAYPELLEGIDLKS